MIPLALRRNTPHQLVFAHGPAGGWVVAAVAAALYGGLLHLAGGWGYLLSDNGGLFATFACGSLVGVGGFVGLWRHRLTVYRRQRRWSQERGLWPFVKTTHGVLDTSVRVELERKSVRDPESPQGNAYPVTLHLGVGIPPILLGKGTARVLGQRILVEMARHLEVPAVDRSGSRAVTTPHDVLEMPPDPHAR
ncbi:MAG: hypothetical protein AAGN66_29630 [Acidobacteriota bacterium]